MPDTGWVYPGTVTGTSWSASDAGTLLHAVTANDNVWAQSAGSNTNYLICSDYSMTIPAGTVEGIEVRLRAAVVGAYVGTAKIGIQYSKDASSPIGDEFTEVFTGYPPDVEIIFGDPTNLGGAAWTVGEINDPLFAVLVRLGSDSVMVTNYQVEDIAVKVYYSESGAGGALTSGMGQMTYDPGIGVTPLRGAVSKER